MVRSTPGPAGSTGADRTRDGVAVQQGGWLDRLILSVLDFLNQPWLGITVALAGSFAVALLARLSPKDDWEFIRQGPDRLLTGAFVVLAGLKSAPRLVLPKQSLVCDRSTLDPLLRIPIRTDCHFVSDGPIRTVYDYTFGDMVREFLLSLLQSVVWGAVGTAAGLLTALLLTRLTRPRTT
jgi:hypothetical protein